MPSEAEARTRLMRMVAHDRPPTLTSDEVDDLMALARRPGPSGVDPDTEVEWAPNTAMVVGEYVVPPDRSGVRYLITVSGGSSGATEPAWGVPGAPVVHDGVTYVGTTEGAWTPTFDLHAAAAEGWRWKAGKVANMFDFSTDQQSFDKSNIFDHCQKMAAYYDARAGTSVYGAGVTSSGKTVTSARMTRDRRVLGMGYRRAPMLGDPATEDEDQRIPWVGNS